MPDADAGEQRERPADKRRGGSLQRRQNEAGEQRHRIGHARRAEQRRRERQHGRPAALARDEPPPCDGTKCERRRDEPQVLRVEADREGDQPESRAERGREPTRHADGAGRSRQRQRLEAERKKPRPRQPRRLDRRHATQQSRAEPPLQPVPEPDALPVGVLVGLGIGLGVLPRRGRRASRARPQGRRDAGAARRRRRRRSGSGRRGRARVPRAGCRRRRRRGRSP